MQQSNPANVTLDPVCGKPVDTAKTEFTLQVGHKIYYFCSATCKFKFAAALERNPGREPTPADFRVRTRG